MKEFGRRLLSRSFFFGLVAMILCASVLYSRAIRRTFLTEELQFVPRENEFLLVTGGIESLWQAIETHFGRVIREEERKGFFSSQLKKLRESLEKKEVPVNELADLAHYGFDLKRGVLFSGHIKVGSTKEDPIKMSQFILLPVQEEKPFVDFYAKLTDQKPNEKLLEIRKGEEKGFEVITFEGKDYLAYLRQSGLALISDSLDHLRRSLFNSKANLTYALEKDALYQGVLQQLRRPLLSGPALFLFWEFQGIPLIRRLVAVARLDKEVIDLTANLELASGEIRVLDDVLKQPPPAVSWQRYLSSDIAAAFVLQDQELYRYLHLLSTSKDVGHTMEGTYGGILGELRRDSTLRRLVLAITGYHDGLPDMLLGVWGDPAELEKSVANLQRELREKRDRAILEKALAAFRLPAFREKQAESCQMVTVSELADSSEAESCQMVTVSELQELGLLEKEEDSLFERYPMTTKDISAADLQRKDFQNPTYQWQYKDWTVHYILPRLTDNDLNYRIEFKDMDRDTLLNDRYRLASTLSDGVLWVATDARDLEMLLDRTRGEDSDTLARSSAFRAASFDWKGQEKIQGFLNMDRVITLGLLNPESQIKDVVKQVLFDLRDHPVVSLKTGAGDGEDHLLLSVRMLHRSGLGL